MHRFTHSRWTRTVFVFAAMALVLSPLLFGGTHAAAPSQVSQIPNPRSGNGQGPHHPPKPLPHPPGANARPGAARPNAVPIWVQETASNPFAFAGGLGMATDSARNTVVLYLPNCGAFPGCGVTSSQTWVWNGTAWNQAAGTQPTPARDHPNMSFDPGTGKVMLFGGLGTGGTNGILLNDTWEFDGTNWSQIVTRNAPSPRYEAAMAPTHGGVMLMGGNVLGTGFSDEDAPHVFATGDTWIFSGGNWSQLCPSGMLPAPRHQAGMATPPGSVIPILYGGQMGKDPVTGNGNVGRSGEVFVANFGGGGPGAGCGWTMQTPTNGAPTEYAPPPPTFGPQPRAVGGFASTNAPSNGILLFSGKVAGDEDGPNTWEYIPGGTPQWQQFQNFDIPGAANQPSGEFPGDMAMATDPTTGTPLLVESGGTWRWAH